MTMTFDYKSEKFTFLKNPVICAITSTCKINNEIDFANLTNSIANVLNDISEAGQYAKFIHKLTKEKTQLHIPIGMKLNGHDVLYRTRYVNYIQNGRLRSNFRNQVCLYYMNEFKKKRCFKIFCNGNIHITGYNDMSSMDSELLLLYTFLHTFTGRCSPANLSIVDQTVHMINLSFKISKSLNLTDLEKAIKIFSHGWSSVYEPDIYCALILHTALFKAIVFKTGSVILTGCKSMFQLQNAFNMFMSFLSEML